MSLKEISRAIFPAGIVAFCAIASLPARAATITACVSNQNGSARFVASPANCIPGLESAVQFNQTGPTGPQGVAGSAGPTGSTGPQGAAGATGATGAQGPAGASGAGFNYRNAYSSAATYNAGDVVLYNSALYLDASTAGVIGVSPDTTGGAFQLFLPQGATGAAGPQGPQGQQGIQGQQGLTGAQGQQGPIGPVGAPGKNGATGPQGPIGKTGPKGDLGPVGPAGPAGPTGPQGTGSSLTYTIHYYDQTTTIPGNGLAGSCDSGLITCWTTYATYEFCPPFEVPVAASCGYQAPKSTDDQRDLILNYSGLNFVPGAPASSIIGAECLVTNASSDTRNSLTGLSCLATVPPTTPISQTASVVKSCTYNPDTQAPCTAADAVVATEVSPGRFSVAPAQVESTTERSMTSSVGNAAKPKSQKSVTLWFRE